MTANCADCKKNPKTRKTNNEPSEQPITEHELLNIIRTRPTNKAAGEDQIPYEMIAHYGPKAMELLLHIYNECWNGKVLRR